MKITISILLLFFMLSWSELKAVDLPAKGKSAPALPILYGPGGPPIDPGVPVGDGLVVLLAGAAFYAAHKRKKQY